ncbi:MAG TPA: 4-alpha-glucanotransferase [Streptosporangiaceae bacterium]|nr:4-alpha-glucanotransferase [Streptosporangiaceae bacterium]
MTDQELAATAQANGVATEYRDWHGRRVPVPRDTLVAVLDALGVAGGGGGAPGSPAPPHATDVARGSQVLAIPRSWGFMVQLYSVRSAASWGHGDLHDLADLAAWSGSALGAGFILINPLHAGEPIEPIRPSPYLPSSRRFVSPLYLRVEDVPGYATLSPEDRARIAELAAPLRARNRTLDPLDRDAVWAAKRAALELIYRRRPPVRAAAAGAAAGAAAAGQTAAGQTGAGQAATGTGPAEAAPGEAVPDAAATGGPAPGEGGTGSTEGGRRTDQDAAAPAASFGPPSEDEQDVSERRYAAYRAGEGAPLTGYATWCALAETHGADWRTWPADLRDPRSPAVTALRAGLADRVDFHAWLQWLVHEQVAAAQGAAKAAGMALGVIHDLAVGVHPGGADAWLYQDVLAAGVTVGAPPDEFNQRGQDWGQPPWHPLRLAAVRYEPYRSLISASLRAAGGLRVDHILGLFRQWWVPAGASPADGTYVRCDHEAMTGLLAGEATKAAAHLIGEDLGVVEPWVRDYLPSRGIFGTSMLWFERDAQGAPQRPERWRPSCLATVATHDLPPIAGYLAGDHIRLRERLGLLTRPVTEEWADHRRQLTAWARLLMKLGLADQPDLAGQVPAATVALHAFLARTPARLIGISLADAVGERRIQNQPGTVDEYPNWRVPLADADGRPVLLDDLPADPRVRAAIAPVLAATQPARP